MVAVVKEKGMTSTAIPFLGVVKQTIRAAESFRANIHIYINILLYLQPEVAECIYIHSKGGVLYVPSFFIAHLLIIVNQLKILVGIFAYKKYFAYICNIKTKEH